MNKCPLNSKWMPDHNIPSHYKISRKWRKSRHRSNWKILELDHNLIGDETKLPYHGNNQNFYQNTHTGTNFCYVTWKSKTIREYFVKYNIHHADKIFKEKQYIKQSKQDNQHSKHINNDNK